MKFSASHVLHIKNPNFIFTSMEAKLTVTIQERGSGVMLDNAMKIKPILRVFFFSKANEMLVIIRKTTEKKERSSLDHSINSVWLHLEYCVRF